MGDASGLGSAFYSTIRVSHCPHTPVRIINPPSELFGFCYIHKIYSQVMLESCSTHTSTVKSNAGIVVTILTDPTGCNSSLT